jgi:hypothetical protein
MSAISHGAWEVPSLADLNLAVAERQDTRPLLRKAGVLASISIALARDSLGRKLDIPFEAFGHGSDSGIDGRHASGGSQIVSLQATTPLGCEALPS